MVSSAHGNPPLSPVLLAGIALRPLPPVLLQPILNLAMAKISRRHPGLFDRLTGLEGATFLIDPIDLPICFHLRASPPPRLTAVADDAHPEAPIIASIRGPLLTLIQLLEGKLDGDALFFSRDLVVEGDTEAVVRLRNAVDGAGIDVMEEILSLFGPFSRPAGRMAERALALFARMDKDLATLKKAVLSPLAERHDAQGAELRRLRETVAELSGKRDSRRLRASGAAGK
ncbi:MAG: ubiquinone anaerobic biosynthesis accessory factor UbiT [Alphaproteobacteria bacterium]